MILEEPEEGDQYEQKLDRYVEEEVQRLIYSKLPKAREIITNKMIGSEPPRLINNLIFSEHPVFAGSNPMKQKLAEYRSGNLVTKNDNSLVTLFEYYDKRKDRLIYNKNYSSKLFAQQQINFNFLYCDINKCLTDRDKMHGAQNKYYTLKENPVVTKQDPLVFESNFQSGNLSKVYKNEANQYDLIINYDINTVKYTHWYFFKATADRDIRATFSIVNNTKPTSLYNKGMKILSYSKFKASKNVGWHRTGDNINYYKNNYLINSTSTKTHYTLQFTYDFRKGDEVYFAYNYPYTYSQLNQYLDQIERTYFNTKIFRREVYCRTLAGNRCEILTITNKHTKNKRVIFMSARVHSGQTVSSYVMKGLIDFLVSSHPIAQSLRDKFIFKIVPMLNPDGVIHGNYRCNLSGSDLNRKWQDPHKNLHAEIYYLKKYILQVHREFQIAMICDLHGHSSKKNIFAYGCTDQLNPYSTRQFPFLFSKLLKNFSYKDCNFEVLNEKQGTARVALYRDLQIPNIFTIQSSFCGAETEDNHFSTNDYELSAIKLCEAINMYFLEKSPETQLCSDRNSKSLFKEKLKYINELRSDTVNTKNKNLPEDSNEQDNQIAVEKPKITNQPIQISKLVLPRATKTRKINSSAHYYSAPIHLIEEQSQSKLKREQTDGCVPKVVNMSIWDINIFKKYQSKQKSNFTNFLYQSKLSQKLRQKVSRQLIKMEKLKPFNLPLI